MIINDAKYLERAEIIREKGTDRSKFLRGQVDKYTWVDVGSSYLPSEMNAAMLLAQLECANTITDNRLASWNLYQQLLSPLDQLSIIEIPRIPDECYHNAHIFYIKTKDYLERGRLIEALKKQQINAVFHYVPLHSSVAGERYGYFHGTDQFTTLESERILRLPLWFGIGKEQIYRVVELIKDFYIT